MRQHEFEAPLHLKVEKALYVDVGFSLLVASFFKQVLDEWLTADLLLKLFFNHGELRSVSVIAKNANKLSSSFNALQLSILPNVAAEA